eukprot:Pgem_evm1s6436
MTQFVNQIDEHSVNESKIERKPNNDDQYTKPQKIKLTSTSNETLERLTSGYKQTTTVSLDYDSQIIDNNTESRNIGNGNVDYNYDSVNFKMVDKGDVEVNNNNENVYACASFCSISSNGML